MVDAQGSTALPWAQVIAAHFALDAAGIYAIAAGTDTLLEDLREHRFMKGFLVLRGE